MGNRKALSMENARVTGRSESPNRQPDEWAVLDFDTVRERLRHAAVCTFEVIVAVAFGLLAIILLFAIFW